MLRNGILGTTHRNLTTERDRAKAAAKRRLTNLIQEAQSLLDGLDRVVPSASRPVVMEAMGVERELAVVEALDAQLRLQAEFRTTSNTRRKARQHRK